MTTSSPFSLRGTEAADLPAVNMMLTQAGLPLDGVSDALPDFVLAESDGHLVGVAGLEVRGRDGLLRSVAVLPEWRGTGVGRALVEAVMVAARARDLRALYLLTTTASGYFPSFGFREITRDDVPLALGGTAEFQGACPSSATVMCCALDRAYAP